MDIKEFIFKIGTIRREVNLSARKLSINIDMNEGYISVLEARKDFFPSMDVFFRILEECGCPAEKFFYHDYDNYEKDMEILEKFKNLSDSKKQALLEFIK